jgi:hypothetical protein
VSNAVENTPSLEGFNEITRLEMALADTRLRLQNAVSQDVHEEDRMTLRSQVGLLLEKISQLKAIGRFRR